MRFASLSIDGDHPIVAGVIGDDYVNLTAVDSRAYASLRGMLAGEGAPISQATQDVERAPRIELDKVQFLPPIPDASKVLCVGRNYAEHAREQGVEIPGEPLIFAKAPSSLSGHAQSVLLPPISDQIDYEAELVVVIGRRTSQVSRDNAMEHVAGYTCGNDVTARDWQKGKPGQQWLLGKSFDTFGPVGPHLVTVDEVPDPSNLTVKMRLNGDIVQAASTRHMMFPVDFLISYLSQVMTLEAGDLLFTGTPSGVGVAREPPVFLQPGDLMEVEIQGVGRLVNRAQLADRMD